MCFNQTAFNSTTKYNRTKISLLDHAAILRVGLTKREGTYGLQASQTNALKVKVSKMRTNGFRVHNKIKNNPRLHLKTAKKFRIASFYSRFYLIPK